MLLKLNFQIWLFLHMYPSVLWTDYDWWGSNSKPQSTSFFEKWNKGAIDVEGQNPVHGTNKLSPNEHNRNSGWGSNSKEPHECPLHVFPLGVLVQLIHHGVNPHSTEEALHCMAHAAATHAEDHHSTLWCQPHHSLHLVFFHHAAAPPNPHVVAAPPWLIHLVMLMHDLLLAHCSNCK